MALHSNHNKVCPPATIIPSLAATLPTFPAAGAVTVNSIFMLSRINSGASASTALARFDQHLPYASGDMGVHRRPDPGGIRLGSLRDALRDVQAGRFRALRPGARLSRNLRRVGRVPALPFLAEGPALPVAEGGDVRRIVVQEAGCSPRGGTPSPPFPGRPGRG